MMTNNLDINLYDRQIRTYGEEAVNKMSTSSVIIIGLESGLSTEIAKNLALGGIKNIYLYDNTEITVNNLETGFYYSKEDIGKIRNSVLKQKIQELNQYVNIYIIEKDSEIEKINAILIIVNQHPDLVSYYENRFKSKIVAVFSKGVAGVIFANAGENHLVTDSMGENIEPVQIGSIDITGKVVCAPHHSHDYQSGDKIKFINIQGTNIKQFNDVEFEINVISPTVFNIKNFDKKDFTFVNGTAIYIKKQTFITHKSFDEQLKNPSFNFSFDDSELIFNTTMDYFKNNKVDSKLASTFCCHIMPVISLIGSVAASEVIKLITNKYVPINQFWCWYDPNLIPETINDKGKTALSKLYGQDFEDTLKKSSWFLVGSGAIGCELLKNLTFINVGTVYVTDPDTIEKSNLNRQFLFRTRHIGKPKSQMAAEAILQLKPDARVIALTDKVCNENQNFCDHIMKNVSGVFNALDNVEARKYMDTQCFNYQTPLFESGTTGTKGNTQAVIPFLTETYSNSADPPQEKTFPACTIKSFPNQIQHTIHWAMDIFEMFNRAPININKWLNHENSTDNFFKEDILSFFVKMNINSYEDCIFRAVDLFDKYFKNEINKLLETFPENHINDDGTKFWSNGKRIPKSINLDYEDENHMSFIEATSHILANIYQIKPIGDIKMISKRYNNYLHNNSEVELIPLVPDYKNRLIPQEFEKDDDSNWHVAWITATSNLRAMNYGIPPISKLETKGIAGRIIPAIATTTSVVSGLIVIEMLKFMLGKKKIENYRSTYVNLADTNLLYSEPFPTKEIEFAGIKYNGWTKFQLKGDRSLKDFKSHFEELFKVEINTILIGNSMLYCPMFGMGDELLDKYMSYLIKNVDEEINLLNPVVITIITDDEGINLPQVSYIN